LVSAADSQAFDFSQPKIEVPPLTFRDGQKFNAPLLPDFAGAPLGPTNSHPLLNKKLVSHMPIIEPRDDVDRNMPIIKPDPSFDHQFVLNPDVELGK
jgi:hypothetical protein